MNKTANKKMILIRIAIIAVALVLLVIGIRGGDYVDVMNKAIRICYECIGIG
jgi:nitrogen fixation-related uncharacterized protein